MVMRFLRGGRDRLDNVPREIVDMLADGRHSFDVATSYLLSGGDREAIGADLRETDRRVNEGERQIRRDLLVHASVHGETDVPALLVYMSIAKDVERIGDYAKNIYDVAAEGVTIAEGEDRDRIIAYRDRISLMIAESSRIFARESVDEANVFLTAASEMQDEFDALVVELLHSSRPASEAVPRALVYRYFKRITAHLMNLLSAVVMPLDRLDYFDEDKPGRV